MVGGGRPKGEGDSRESPVNYSKQEEGQRIGRNGDGNLSEREREREREREMQLLVVVWVGVVMRGWG